MYRELDVGLLHASWRELNKAAAGGVDRVTAEAYERDLDANIQRLARRLKTKRYRAQRVRGCYIAKDDGGHRPLGIPVLEDRLVQHACAKLLDAIYERDFLAVSYGYRAGQGPQDAVRDLGFNLQYGRFGHVVEADIQGFFDPIDPDRLLEMLSRRIDDRAFLGLIRKWLKSGILDTDGQVLHPESGAPQGGVVSPVLANVYLHHVLDEWFEREVKPRCAGQALLIRFADDDVCAFQYRDDAERFYRVQPKRVAKYGLTVAADKTRIRRFSRFHPGLPRRFAFLGFELYWARDRQGRLRVMRRTAPKKLQGAKRRMKAWIKANRHLPARAFVAGLNRKLTGHYNYYGLRGNQRSLASFYNHAIACVYKWRNRRGGKRASHNWASAPPPCGACEWRSLSSPSSHGVTRSLRSTLSVANASTTEEPDAGKLHVRVCAGGAG